MQQDYNKSPLRIFAGFYRPQLGLFILDMFCALLIALIEVAYPLVTRYTINRILPQNAYGTFFAIMGAMAGAYVLRSALQYVVTYWGHIMGIRLEAGMRKTLFEHLQNLSFKFYDSYRTGHIMSRVTTDLFEITELAHHGPEDVFISALTFIGAFIILFNVNPKLSLVLIVLVPLALIFTVLQRKRMSAASKLVKENTAGINADIESSISGARVAKAFANEAYEVDKFEIGNERFKKSKGGFYSAMAFYLCGMEFMTSVFSVAVITFGGLLIMRGELTIIDLLTFSMYVATFVAPVRKLTQFVEQYSNGIAGFNRFVEIMRMRPDITDAPDAQDLKDVRGDIEFKDVSFSYNEKTCVLEHLNITVPSGKTLAIVGPSGGGKTTLCNLIPRFYEISGGSITIDGVDIRGVTLHSLRYAIGIVSQDVFLFAGSIRENIRYGKIDATEQEIVEAARRAQIYDMILDLPHGLDTDVGERGVKLSGGQKQRVSIARIFLKNPPVLILDEATSALDTVTERLIQSSFEELAKGRTTLVIAHRLSTVQNADEIIYIDEEGVKERGTHARLLAQNGLYANLYNTQFI